MRKFLLPVFLLGAIFCAVNSAFAAEDPDPEIVCKTSTTCKQACDLKITDKLEETTPDQQKIIIQCAQDMMKKFNFKK